jgi:hypothetical protein
MVGKDDDTLFATTFVVCSFALWFGTWAGWRLLRRRRRIALLQESSDWAEVNGRVTNSKVTWGHVEIRYEYEIAGRRFQGKYEISLPMVPFMGLAAAQRFNDAAKSIMADYPPGQTLALKYNPLNERQTVLISG